MLVADTDATVRFIDASLVDTGGAAEAHKHGALSGLWTLRTSPLRVAFNAVEDRRRDCWGRFVGTRSRT